MRAGKLTERITVYKPRATVDQYGERHTEFAEVGTWYAERETQTSTLIDEAAEHFPDYRVTWRLRLRHQPKEHWQVEDADGHRYDIIGIERRNGMQPWNSFVRIKCDRINP